MFHLSDVTCYLPGKWDSRELMPRFFPAVLCLRMPLAEQMIKTRLLILIAALFREKSKTKNPNPKQTKKPYFLKNFPELCTCIMRLLFSKVSANYICALHSNSGWIFFLHPVWIRTSLYSISNSCWNYWCMLLMTLYNSLMDFREILWNCRRGMGHFSQIKDELL